jgi:hypothetical protein
MKPSILKMCKWRKKNKERQRENDRRFRMKHRSRMLAKYRKRYINNRQSELARNKAYYPAYYKKHGKAIRLRRRCHIHGCTSKWIEEKLIEQQNRCAVCRNVFTKTPHIDHDHKCCPTINRRTCGKCNRGLLCDDCNLGLGRFKDSIELLKLAIQYLKDS